MVVDLEEEGVMVGEAEEEVEGVVEEVVAVL